MDGRKRQPDSEYRRSKAVPPDVCISSVCFPELYWSSNRDQWCAELGALDIQCGTHKSTTYSGRASLKYLQTLDGVQKQYNSSTFWLVGNAQLFWQSGLDPNEQHQIELINAAGAGMIVTVNDFTVYAANVSAAG